MLRIRYALYFAVLLFGILIVSWIRYGWLISQYYTDATQPLAEMRMRYALRNDNIVISLTTTPYRIDKLRPVLETLYKQNIKINKIYLSIPHIFQRDDIEYEIPKWLRGEPKITILRPLDFGPATKLLGVLSKVKFPANTIIVTVDDDMHYPSNLVLNLAYAAKLHPKNAITTMGCDLDYTANGALKGPGIRTKIRFEPDALVSMILGYVGVAYRPEFFDAEIFNIESAPKECYMIDDFYISFHLARRAVARRSLGSKYVSYEDVQCIDEMAYEPQALFIITPDRAKFNEICLTYLQSKYPNVSL